MMNGEEVQMDRILYEAKTPIRDGIQAMGLNATDPVALALLRVLDSIDKARAELAKRRTI